MSRGGIRARAGGVWAAARKRPTIFRLWLRNHLSRSSVLGSAGSVVSLTTYGPRLRTVYLAVESIADGHVKPQRLMLWLSPPESEMRLPASLTRLERRGLEILYSVDYRSYKKYFPYVLESDSRTALVTTDDDVLYPRSWLQGLERHSERYPSSVVCHRAHVLSTTPVHTGIAAYEGWRPCTSTLPSVLNVATGVSGILYPRSFQQVMRDAGDEFLKKAPQGDDIWLHFLAITHGFTIAQVADVSADFPTVPGSGVVSLVAENLDHGGNDVQIAATYTPEAIQILREAETTQTSISKPTHDG